MGYEKIPRVRDKKNAAVPMVSANPADLFFTHAQVRDATPGYYHVGTEIALVRRTAHLDRLNELLSGAHPIRFDYALDQAAHDFMLDGGDRQQKIAGLLDSVKRATDPVAKRYLLELLSSLQPIEAYSELISGYRTAVGAAEKEVYLRALDSAFDMTMAPDADGQLALKDTAQMDALVDAQIHIQNFVREQLMPGNPPEILGALLETVADLIPGDELWPILELLKGKGIDPDIFIGAQVAAIFFGPFREQTAEFRKISKEYLANPEMQMIVSKKTISWLSREGMEGALYAESKPVLAAWIEKNRPLLDRDNYQSYVMEYWQWASATSMVNADAGHSRDEIYKNIFFNESDPARLVPLVVMTDTRAMNQYLSQHCCKKMLDTIKGGMANLSGSEKSVYEAALHTLERTPD